MSESRFGCRPWICSSVTTLTGASASIARSSVFDAATVMVSSDCTGVAPLCARAFMTGEDACWFGCGFAGFRLACFGCSDGACPACVSAVCARPAPARPAPARPAPDSVTANENADTPRIKAREYPAPSAITTQPNVIFSGLAGVRCAMRKRLAGCQFQERERPARIVSELVTSRNRSGQERDGGVYIDCKFAAVGMRYAALIQDWTIELFGAQQEGNGRNFRRRHRRARRACGQALCRNAFCCKAFCCKAFCRNEKYRHAR